MIHRDNLSNILLQLLEYLFLTIDLLCNIFDDYFGHKLTLRLSVYICQNLSQILALILLCLLFFQSKILQAGYLRHILRPHCYGLIISIIYLFTTVTLQFQIITVYWNKPLDSDQYLDTKEWSKCKITFIWFVGQRILASIYYICYRRVSSVLHDPDLIDKLAKSNPPKRKQTPIRY